MSPCRFSSSPFCRLNRHYFLDFRLFLLFSVFLLIELFEIKSLKWDTVFQTKVYGEGAKITPCVLHRIPSLTASVMRVWGFGGGMANWLMAGLWSSIPSACFCAELLWSDFIPRIAFELGYPSVCLHPCWVMLCLYQIPLMNVELECLNKMWKQPWEQWPGFASIEYPNHRGIQTFFWLYLHIPDCMVAQLHGQKAE